MRRRAGNATDLGCSNAARHHLTRRLPPGSRLSKAGDRAQSHSAHAVTPHTNDCRPSPNNLPTRGATPPARPAPARGGGHHHRIELASRGHVLRPHALPAAVPARAGVTRLPDAAARNRRAEPGAAAGIDAQQVDPPPRACRRRSSARAPAWSTATRSVATNVPRRAKRTPRQRSSPPADGRDDSLRPPPGSISRRARRPAPRSVRRPSPQRLPEHLREPSEPLAPLNACRRRRLGRKCPDVNTASSDPSRASAEHGRDRVA